MAFKTTALIPALATIMAFAAAAPSAGQQTKDYPAAQQWADLSKLPQFAGTWEPDPQDQHAQTEGYRYANNDKSKNPFPWNAAMAKQSARQKADFQAGRPLLVFSGCLPLGMPSEMLVSHNAMEILLTPGRVTMLTEGDGNRLRRIYTDGRGHPEDPDLSFYGHSIGHWEGDTLVVDTVGILPQTAIAEGEGSGLPNNGGMHIVERIHLVSADVMHDDMVIDAPKAFSHPYKTTRIWNREKENQDIAEGVCRQGEYREAKDKQGNAIFVPNPTNNDGTARRKGLGK